MATSEHLKIILTSVRAWNKWRKANTKIVPNLSRADLRFKKLNGADLNGADLSGADLAGADLDEAHLIGANLHEANLSEASLRLAPLSRADLTGARLKGAHLGANLISGANLIGADLSWANLGRGCLDAGADLTGTIIGYTTFGENDLSDVKGLETVRHVGPSTIGIDTIYRSHGKIPLAFLRRAGVPENFIEYMGSLTGKALDFYSCFISYSTKDQEFADHLYADLQNKGVRCWFAPHDLRIGDKFQEVIEERIRVYEKLLIILSESSVNSDWVEREVQAAMEKERRSPGNTVPLPIRLDDAVMESNRAWAADIRRTRHIGDFRKWKDHDSLKSAFERLLRDLETKGPKAA